MSWESLQAAKQEASVGRKHCLFRERFFYHNSLLILLGILLFSFGLESSDRKASLLGCSDVDEEEEEDSEAGLF